jgi:hypothetical protein
LLFVLLWLATAIAGWRPGPLAAGWPLRRRALGWGLAGLVLLCAAVLVLGLDPGYTPRRGVVLFYDAGQLDWGRPEYGRYGARSGGTYGLWPDYLSLYGYEFRAGELSAENLAAARVVMLVNLQQALPAEEKARLLSWVEAGGGLVIWGEHTGFGTIREPLNDLLTALPGAPLRLRFDSAVPVRQGWAEGLDLLPHPALRGVADPLDLVIAVGASFDVAPPARPLIVGRFGHSDWGDPDNAMRNYVGDMRPNPDERLGDVVLAAEVRHGAGRIVVMGDTTPLGSVNLMTTMPFHARLLDWVAGEAAGWTPVLTGGLLGAVLLLAALVLVWRGRSRLALAAAALVLGLGLAGLDAWNEARSAPPLPAGPIAYVDAAHHGRFDRLLWEDTSTGGLAYNLSRAGLVPLLLRDLDAEALAGADLLVVVAPEQEYRQGEIDAVADWVEVGGQLLVTVGSEEAVASQALLARFGLSVGHVPLGPASVERAAGTVRFHEAWPVAAADGVPAETVVEAYGYPVVLYRAWGAGGVALVGDSEFLLGPNLEAETQYTEGNILLLRDLLHEWMAMAPREGTP